MQKAYDINGNEVQPNNGIDVSIFQSAADDLVGEFEYQANFILKPLIYRAMTAKRLKENDAEYVDRCRRMGYNEVEEPICLAKWKFMYEMVFDHGLKYDKETRSYHPTSVLEAFKYNYYALQAKKPVDQVAVDEALAEAKKLNAFLDSDVEARMGIPAEYTWYNGKEDESVPGFYDVVLKAANWGDKHWSFWAEQRPNWEHAHDRRDSCRMLKRECLA